MSSWSPEPGIEVRSFLQRQTSLDQEAKDRMLEDAKAILGQGVNPEENNGQRTGLVIGYVQSGKTLSFETVMALAADNGYRIIILIAGSSRILFSQSVKRAKQHLGIERVDSSTTAWLHLENPSQDSDRHAIESTIASAKKDAPPGFVKKTILITVMKQHKRLEDLVELMSSFDAREEPILIIDDEGDQASLNTMVNNKKEDSEKAEEYKKYSTTYHHIMKLRNCLGNCTYLQYTATPQALLLLNTMDFLSPNFVRILEPGEQYVGGKDFFGEGTGDLTLPIPNADLVDIDDPNLTSPKTLTDALELFVVGTAIGLTFPERRHFSMIVHPSFKKDAHLIFSYWVQQIIREWEIIMDLDENAKDRIELIEKFRKAYDNLAARFSTSIPPLEHINIQIVLENVQIREINTREKSTTPIVDWHQFQIWILIGGQSLDRGYTVEGLTVTYMPRSLGAGNADTLQQRARFFGYKKKYLEYCRIFLVEETIEAYKNYVIHEESLRKSMLDLQDNGEPLKEWKRTFILDSRLRPCRAEVISDPYVRFGTRGEWWVAEPILLPSMLEDREIVQRIEENRKIVADFISNYSFQPMESHPESTEQQKHTLRSIPLKEIISDLLCSYKFSDVNSASRHNALLIHLSKINDETPNSLCKVYCMSPKQVRNRSVNSKGGVSQLFQGPNPKYTNYKKGEVYPGDREIKANSGISLQIHILNLSTDDEPEFIKKVPVIAVNNPVTGIQQDQTGQ